MTSSSTCGTNSTCLLEAILAALEEANDEFKWDFPSFVATLLLGLIALGYAVVPIIQGLLARLSPQRYNALAIGRWSEETKFSWSWSELRFLAVVRTPLLDLRRKPDISRDSKFRVVIKDGVKIKKRKKSDTSGLPDLESVDGRAKASGMLVFNRQRRPYAGWLKLLQHIYANDDFWVKIFENNLETPADIIPSELPAAHAFGTVETITVLAILAGCTSIRITEGYPFLRGTNMQLEFRSHTTLGIIAVFTRIAIDYDGELEQGITAMMSRASNPRDLVLTGVDNLHGILEFNGMHFNYEYAKATSQVEFEKIYTVDTVIRCEQCGFNHWDDVLGRSESTKSFGILALLMADIPRHPGIFPSRLLEIHTIVSCIAIQSSFLKYLALHQELLDLNGHMASLFTNSTSRMSLASHVSIFGLERGAYASTVIRAILKSGKNRLGKNTPVSWAIGTNIMRPDWGNYSEHIMTVKLDSQATEISPVMDSFNMDSMVIIPTAIEIAVDWLCSPVEFTKRTSRPTQDEQDMLLLQLQELDFWLAKDVQDDAVCVSFKILENVVLLQDVHKLACQREEIESRKDEFKSEDGEKLFNEPIDRIWGFLNSSKFNPTSDGVSQLVDDRLLQLEGMMFQHSLWQMLEFEKERQDFVRGQLDLETFMDLNDVDGKNKLFLNSIWRVRGPGEENGDAVVFYVALRAVLLGALLALGADSSDVLHLETLDQIVPLM